MILFYLISTKVDFALVFAQVYKLNFILLSSIFLLMFFQLIVASTRWHRILYILNITLSFRECIAYTWVGMFFSQALPSSIGGDAYKILQIRSLGFSYKDAFSSVVNDRIFGLLGLLSIILIFPFIALAMGHKQILEINLSHIILASLSGIFLFFCLPKVMNLFRYITYLKNFLDFIEGFFLLRNSPKTILFLVSSSVFIHLMTIFVFLLISSAMSVKITPIAFFILVPLMVLVTTLPISIAGWGLREGFFVFSLGQFGVEPEQSVFISILYGVLVLIFSIPGSSMWFFKNVSFNSRDI